MFFDWGFRQKVIRVFASAAITGLSVSFVVGEIVDEKAKQLFAWDTDSEIFPSGYSPLQPLTASLRVYDQRDFTTELLAKNSGTEIIEKKDELQQPQVVARVAPVEQIHFIASSPIKPTRKISKPKVERANDEAETQKSLEQVQESIQKMTQKLVRVDATATVQDNQVKEAKDSTPELALPKSPWMVTGSLAAANVAARGGHFEIGLYTKIDPQGNPIGYPLIQEILPAGQTRFQLKAPAQVTKAYVFGEYIGKGPSKKQMFVPAQGNPIERVETNGARPLLLVAMEDRIIRTSSALVSPDGDHSKIKGLVTTMFVANGKPIPQADVVVKLRGRKESARTDKEGKFFLDLHQRVKGNVTLEFLKGGYFPTILTVALDNPSDVVVELASRDAIDQISQALGLRQISSLGVFVGKAVAGKDVGLKGVSAQMNLRAEGPFYFEDGFPNRDLKATTNDGRFIYFNVEPGVGALETSVNGENYLPVPLSYVDGGQMIQKNLVPSTAKISGRVFSPVQTKDGKLNPIPGARVHLMGETDSAITDSLGAYTIGPVKYFLGEPVTIEFSAEKFYSHKFSLKSLETVKDNLDLYVFTAAYINKLASSVEVTLSPYSAIIMGKVSGLGARIDAMAEHSTTNTAKDFYFDYKGNLRGSHTHTDPRFGTYVIFNVPKGGVLLHGNDGNGKLIYSDSLDVSASSVHVVLD